MEEQNVVIEITDTEIRLLAGYVSNNKPNICYVASKSINGLISHGEINDYQTLTQILLSMKNVQDEKGEKIIKTDEVTLILPAIGLNIFQCEKTTKVVSPESIISSVDIQNVIEMINKEPTPPGTEVIEIVPDQFILDGNRITTVQPLNEKSDSLTLKAKVHTLPSRTVAEYKRVIENAKLSVRKFCLNSYAACELAKYTPGIPDNYILVDMGSEVSEISLIGNKSPFGTVAFHAGGQYIVKNIVEKFRIQPEEALDLLTNRGYSTRKLTFEPIIAEYIVDGETKSFTQNDLNKIISDYFRDDYFPGFKAAFETLLAGYDDVVKRLPIVFIGGFSMMIGFKDLAEKEFTNQQAIYFLAPSALGARSAQNTTCVGGLLIACSSKGALSDQKRKHNAFSR